MTHAELAQKYFLEGYNCAQAVFMAFCDVTGLDEKQAARTSAPFGGGMGRMREVCGTVSGMYMVLGSLCGYDDPTNPELKQKLYSDVRELGKSFAQAHSSVVCREILKSNADKPVPETEATSLLKSAGHNPYCLNCVMSAATIIDEYINRNKING